MDYIYYICFFGKVRLGVFEDEFMLVGGMCKYFGLYYVILYNVMVGDNCCIENIKNYIVNYIIGDYVFIENVDIILVDGWSKFGNGVEVVVLNEMGGCEVFIYDCLLVYQVYILVLYCYCFELICWMKVIIDWYVEENVLDIGIIGYYVIIVDVGYIKNV